MVRIGEEYILVGVNHAVPSQKEQDLANCEWYGTSTAVYKYRDWIEKTIKAEGAELPKYASLTHSLNQGEVQCSQTVNYSFDTYSEIYHRPERICAKIGIAGIESRLRKIDLECKQICGQVEAFAGYCEQFEKGLDKMINHVKTKCKS